MYQAVDSLGGLLVAGNAVAPDDPRRSADDRAIGRDVTHHDKSIGADLDIVTNFNRPQEGCAGTDEYIVPQRGMAFALMFAGSAQGDIMKQHAVVPDNRRFTDHNSGAMIDKEPPTNRRPRVYLQPGEEP